jgi:hypothetical protein
MGIKYEHKVDWCDVCEQGWIEIKRNSDSNKIVFKCSECYVEYESYDKINKETIKDSINHSAISLTEQELVDNNLWCIVIKEWENYRLVRNDGKVIKVWSKERKKFI